MATLPANINPSAGVPVPGNNLATGFSGLNFIRQAGLLVGLAASIAVGFAVVLWSQEPDYSPLLSDMSNVDASQAVDILRGSDIPYKVDTRSGGLMVPTPYLHDARMKLSAVGISDNRSVGFELLDKEQGLGTSQFMENISYRRGLEGEIARTISSLNSVRSARVHLAIPKASVFIRDSRKPRASVFIELLSGRRLQDGQISAIVNLVASSVPEMDSSEVTIVDQNGRLLSDQGESETAAMAAHQFEYVRKTEDVLVKRLQRILQPVVGMDKYKAEVSADLDFTALEETAEVFNPNQTTLRSEQTLDEQRSSGAETGGVPGALSNQPPGAASVPEQAVDPATGVTTLATPGNSRTQATRNYEIDRSVSYTRHEQGKIRRLSVAVVIDNRIGTNEAGEATSEAWPQADIDQITSLVRGAVGYDEARGDLVTVVNTPFAVVNIETPIIEETPIWEQGWFQKLVKQALAGILVLILVFAVIRPITKSLSDTGAQRQALVDATANAQAAAIAAATQPAGGAQLGALSNGATNPAIMAGTAGLLAGPGANYESQLAAAQGVVAQDSQRAAQVLRQWVTVDE